MRVVKPLLQKISLSVLDDREHRALGNKKKVCFLLQQATAEDQSASLSLTPVLRQIISSGEKKKKPSTLKAFRGAEEIFHVFFYLCWVGIYFFLQENLPQALPSVQSIQNIVHSEYKTINEGDFRFNELAAHIMTA